jgi:hypothetical protein
MNSNSTSSTQKYRPALTAQEIAYLIDLCNLDSRPETSELGFAIASRLRVFKLKTELGVTGAAFSSTPKETMEQKLGLEDIVTKRQKAYDLWRQNPDLVDAKGMRLVEAYRYDHGLMSAEEIEEYERI